MMSGSQLRIPGLRTPASACEWFLLPVVLDALTRWLADADVPAPDAEAEEAA